MTRIFSAALAATLALFVASCGDTLTAPVAPAAPDNPSLILIEDGTTIWEPNRLAGLVRERWVCLMVDDVSGACCPSVNPETNRGFGVSTVRGVNQDIVVFGDEEKAYTYSFFVLADRHGVVHAIVEGFERFDRRIPYPTDIPALFYDATGVPPEAEYGLAMCGEGVYANVTPECEPGSRMKVVEFDGFGYLWKVPRRDINLRDFMSEGPPPWAEVTIHF